MARRAGKAASRKARQRRAQRPLGQAPAAPRPASAPETVGATPAPTSASVSTPAAPSSRGAPARQTVGSQLTASERSEYHYVERDLRDIGMLTVVMAVLLGLSYVVVHALNIVP